MSTLSKGVCGAVMALVCLSSAVQAKPAGPGLTVDDILRLEAIERADLSPEGRWAVYEKRGAYDSLPNVALRGRSPWTLMQLWLVDLNDPDVAPRRMLTSEGNGLQRVAWSPSGDRLLITRIKGDAFEYGVMSLPDLTVSWTGLTPDMPPNGASAEWVSDSVVLLLASPDGRLPASLRYDRDITTRRAEAWGLTVAGRTPSRTVLEASGGILTTETRPPENALVRLDVSTGGRRVLASGQIADFSASPDGRSVAVVRRADPVPLNEPELVQLENEQRLRLAVLTTDEGRPVTELAGIDLAPHLLRWSGDSLDVLVWGRRDGQRWSEGRLVAVGRAGVRTFDLGDSNVGTSVDVVAGVKAEWLGNSPILYAGKVGSDRRDWILLTASGAPKVLTAGLKAAPARIAAVDGNVALVFADDGLWEMSRDGVHRIDTGSLALTELTGVVDIFRPRRSRINEAPRRDWVMAKGPGGEPLVMSRSGDTQRLGQAGSVGGRLLAMSQHAVVTLQPTGVSETLRLGTTAGDRNLDAVNTNLATTTLSEPSPVRHLDLNGKEVTSWIFLPEGEIKGVIVKVYPGWTDNLVWGDPFTLTYSTRPDVFVAAGYAYLSPYLPGDLPPETRGEGYVRSVDLAIAAAAEAYPRLPLDRMVLWGHSFGGYAALEIATRSDRFQSYIASAAYSDMFGVWGEFDPGARILPEDGGLFRFNQLWTEITQGALKAPPWSAAERYAASSPYLRADHITRPVLFLTGDMDFAPSNQAERMFSAILRNGGQAKIVTYWGEQHLIFSPANIRDYYAQIFDWLERSFQPARGVSVPVPGEPPTFAPIPRSP